MAQQQRIDERVAEFADADLQRAAVRHERANAHRDRVIDRTQRQIRRAEELVVVAWVIDQVVEARGVDAGAAEHEGQAGMHGADQHDIPAGRARRLDLRQQIHGNVGVRAQGELHFSRDRALRDELRNHVRTAREKVARNMRVVRREVVLLCRIDPEPGAGLEEELDHLDVGRQCAGLRGEDIVQFGVVGEHPLDDWLEQASREVATCLRPRQ